MSDWLPEVPVVQAPMAGGASTPELVAAVCEAGGLGFLAAGYRTAARMRAEITRTRELTRRPFGVNVFLPAADPVDDAAVAAYRERLRPEAERLGVEPGAPGPRDDDWDAKVTDLLADPPAVVGFTFGRPDAAVVRAFQRRGTAVVVTVTTPDEARRAGAADALCVQGREAGAHRGSFTNGDGEHLPVRELVPRVREVTATPLIAAGGIATADHVREMLLLGAVAVQAGTAFLRAPESGASEVHKNALADPRYTRTAMTRAFSGRPARGLVNRFLAEHSPHAPAAYPDVHHLTAPLRRAAAARRDPEGVNLWAGESWRLATAEPAHRIVAALAGKITNS
ncbi:nitronate monooxygenase [Actinomadura kijaniata]|uniref:Probable nitronate monooxygenase n=1 Tax=Actinomadura namibiensis TaxID=182080 RepID=A0A7W3LU92_ACTNM|nr:nitronate monooxygenase [Actinomadura namibiensis]MBA8954352.1 nitronate monooxygenase [Actinomadura namibiensis]